MSYNPLPQPATSIILTGVSTAPVSFSNPFPVSLGSSSITINGDVVIPGIVTVTSTPENPIHSHLVEVGTSGTINTPYLPIGISTLQNDVGIGTTGQVSLNLNSFPVSASNPLPVTGTITLPETGIDAFGRQRVSNPLTLFDSSHRYRDNNLWNSLVVGSGSTVGFITAQGLVNLSIGTTSGCYIIRESTKVFAYQPGKSLEVLNTYVMNAPKQNLKQKVGYYGADNGMYVELDGDTLYFVERTSVSGITTETRKAQSEWNVDTLLGPGHLNPSGITLDVSKAQILWMDIEWLGLGTVRMGFVIDGKFIHCHSFHHANLISSTYITTASLPIRYEIANTGVTTSSSTLKQVCSTVISEGGYELRGLQQAVGTSVTSPIGLTTAGTFYNLISIRLKSTRLDAIAILTALSLMGATNNTNYNWQVRASGISSGGTWVSAGADSSIEYKLDGGVYTGGRILASGFFNASQQSTVPVDILKEALFKFQLERDGLTGTPYELSLVCASDNNGVGGANVFASMDWEEVSR